MSVSIITPVFREAGNIALLAKRIEKTLAGSGIEWELVLVDDNSNDGSEAVVAQLAKQLPVRIEVRHDPPRDLSLSVLRGFQIARFDKLVVMDADLSHPPANIAHLLATLDSSCDIVVGSRYIAGGTFERNWGPLRFLNSRVASLLARPLTKCSDPMSGFFAINRGALPDTGTLRPLGYKVALELIVRGRLRVKEIPIGFRDRAVGVSKMNWRQQIKFLRHLRRLYFFKFGGITQVMLFGMVGASGFVLDASCYLGLQWAGLEHRLARFLSFWPAVTWNWWLNRHITFSERRREPHRRQWAKFVASSLVSMIANVGSYAILTTFFDLFSRHKLAALLCGVVLGSICNFLAANFLVYRLHTTAEQSGAKCSRLARARAERRS